MKELKLRNKTLLWGIGIAFILFSFARTIFFTYNYDAFSSSSFVEIGKAFLIGIWFDTVPVFYYNLLFIFFLLLPFNLLKYKTFRGCLLVLFLFTNAVALFQNLADVAYFPFNKKRTGAEILHLSKEWNVGQLAQYVFDFWFLFLLFLLVVFGTFFFVRRIYIRTVFVPTAEHSTKKNLVYNATLTIGWLIITLLGLRGGFGLIPLRTFDAGKYVESALVPLTINTPFQFICTIEGNNAPDFDFMSDEQAEAVIKPIKKFETPIFDKRNVVIVIVESLGKEYMGFYNRGKGFTPFLDSLCQYSLTFEKSFANGTTSMDAPPAIFSGIPNIMEDSYIISQFNINTPKSIGSILRKEGYSSSFYHGGKNGTMGFDNFISQCDMGEYFGLNEYPNKNDFDGKWGIFDEPYLQYFAQELTKKKEPFISAVFTLSSHHPYTIPDKYKNTLPKGEMPIYQSIAYTDLALKKFFETAKKQAWYQNTLFVITADHTSDSRNPEYQTTLGHYSIPHIFFDPRTRLKIEDTTNVIQHSSISSTILKQIGYKKAFFSMSKPATDTSSFAIFYSNNSYFIVKSNLVLTMNKDGKCKLFDWKNDPNCQIDISSNKIARKNDMESTLKAYLQTSIRRLKNNTFGQND